MPTDQEYRSLWTLCTSYSIVQKMLEDSLRDVLEQLDTQERDERVIQRAKDLLSRCEEAG